MGCEKRKALKAEKIQTDPQKPIRIIGEKQLKRVR